MTRHSRRFFTASRLPLAAVVFVLISCRIVAADGVIIDTIYDPYVQPLEKELEWRAIWQTEQPGRPDYLQVYRMAYGQSLGQKWFGEVYLVGTRSADDAFEVEGWEIEAKRQLTEQGEYWADWGLLFELEKERGMDAWEVSAGVLAEKEWGKWSTTANLFIKNEFGSDIENELETQAGIRVRYRLARAFEPAIEIYSGEDTRGIGPAFLGQARLGGKRQLKWQAGWIIGIGSASPEHTLRAQLEFEF
jgi:hypothetical protein